jgi:hypothetical protein
MPTWIVSASPKNRAPSSTATSGLTNAYVEASETGSSRSART